MTKETYACIARAQAEIRADIDAGILRPTVRTFAELHDYVDANEYGGLTADDCPLSHDDTIRVQSSVDQWLRRGGAAK